MSNVLLTFYGDQLSTNDGQISCFSTNSGKVIIKISNLENDLQFIALDKNTAIKLSKELRKQISMI